MNEAGLKDLSSALVHSLSVIKLNTQLAYEVERLEWANKYLDEITKEIDNLSGLVNKIQDCLGSACFNPGIDSGVFSGK